MGKVFLVIRKNTVYNAFVDKLIVVGLAYVAQPNKSCDISNIEKTVVTRNLFKKDS